MRTVNELLSFAERYYHDNESPFLIVDETERNEYVKMDFSPGRDDVPGWTATPAAGHESAEMENVLPPADNMGGTKYREDSYPAGWGGYDGGCEASLLGSWEALKFDNLCRRLELARQSADDGQTVDAFVDFGGFVWMVRAVGAKVGPFKYKFVLESHGIKLYIHSNPKNDIPGVQVRFGFECLCRTGLFDAVQTLETCLKMEGYHVQHERISRVDTQILLPVELADFLQVMQGTRVVTRCRGTYHMIANMKTGKVETILIGSENVELCIYDKRSQLLKTDAIYYDTFKQHILQGDDVPDVLTRIEFRFKRAYLKRYGIETFDDLRNSISALLDIVSSDWFRILSRDKVRGSENEIEDCALWQRVRKAFQYYFAEHAFTTRTVGNLRNSTPVRPAPQIEKLIRQMLGCLSSAAACVLGKITDSTQITEYCENLLRTNGHIIQFNTIKKKVLNSVLRGYRMEETALYPVKQDIMQALPSDDFPGAWAF